MDAPASHTHYTLLDFAHMARVQYKTAEFAIVPFETMVTNELRNTNWIFNSVEISICVRARDGQARPIMLWKIMIQFPPSQLVDIIIIVYTLYGRVEHGVAWPGLITIHHIYMCNITWIAYNAAIVRVVIKLHQVVCSGT